MLEQRDLKEQIEESCLALMRDATAMRLDLSSDDAQYGINYISSKLALCSSYLERLSDIEMKLIQTKLQVSNRVSAYKGLLDIAEREVRGSDEYVNQSRDVKGQWLAEKVKTQRKDLEDWMYVNRVVCEVREAVVGRIQNMKRLDSDIRLHQKLLELKIAAGATSPSSYTGSKATAAGELEL